MGNSGKKSCWQSLDCPGKKMKSVKKYYDWEKRAKPFYVYARNDRTNFQATASLERPKL